MTPQQVGRRLLYNAVLHVHGQRVRTLELI